MFGGRAAAAGLAVLGVAATSFHPFHLLTDAGVDDHHQHDDVPATSVSGIVVAHAPSPA